MATSLKGTFFMGQTNPLNDNVKAFAAKSCDGIYVMLMNQNTGSKNYRINLNATMPTTTSTETCIQIGLNGVGPNSNHDFVGTISGEETRLLRFDPCGRFIGYYEYDKNMTVPNAFAHVPGYKKSCACLGGGGAVNNTARCTSLVNVPPHTIQSDSTITDSLYVLGPINVPRGVTLRISSAEMVFATGGGIFVEPPTVYSPGGRVIITDSYLRGCNGETWAGIVISSKDTGRAPLVIDNSTIEDALMAIQADTIGAMMVTNSSFSNGTEAISINYGKNITISNNRFINYVSAIKTSNTNAGVSVISNNFIADVGKGITFLNDDHSQLDISCNEFHNYGTYAVQSVNTTLKNQGSAAQGAGNTFFSSSTLLNNKFSHSGNNMTYYTDPSSPFTLVTGLGMNATATVASANGCGSSARASEPIELSQKQADANRPGILSTVPNPNNGFASVYYKLGMENTAAELVITNLYGEIIARYALGISSEKVDIDCSALANGIYFASLLQQGKPIDCKKMMIAK